MSIWLAESFIGAKLCKNGRWMRTLPCEEDGDGGFCFIVWKRCNIICSEVHAVLADLPFHRSNTKLGPAGEFAVDFVSNTPGLSASRCGSTACCNCRFKSYNPVLLIFYMGLGEIFKVYFE